MNYLLIKRFPLNFGETSFSRIEAFKVVMKSMRVVY